MKRLFVYGFFVLIIYFFANEAYCSDFYLDPINGKLDGDGSIVNPFPSLQSVVENKLISGYQCETLPYKSDCNKVFKKPEYLKD